MEKWICPEKKVLQHWINECSKVLKKLSPREQDFVSSVNYQLEHKDELTRPQVEWLESIYTEHT